MPRVDFLLTSPSHHLANALPVIRELAARGLGSRVLSLCEIRGLKTPFAELKAHGVDTVRVVPIDIRPSPEAGRGGEQRGRRALRGLLQSLHWQVFLRWRMRRLTQERTTVTVIPNDAAYPFNRTSELLLERGSRVVVLQEGIRFDTPSTALDGASGATAYAVWGPSSARYFESRAVPKDRIRVTGCPRFDNASAIGWRSQARTAIERHGLTERTLLFLSNPIDDLGLVSTRGKLGLFRRFTEALAPMFADPSFRLLVKLHRRESPADFRAAIADHAASERIVITRDEELHPLVVASQAAVMFASTAGLEVLLFNKPLALLEIPGTAFPHEFVSSGAARGITWEAPLEAQIRDWTTSWGDDSSLARRREFVEQTLSSRGQATRLVADLITELSAAPLC